MNKNCNCIYEDDCKCPTPTSCLFYETFNDAETILEEDEDTELEEEEPLTKNRELSRKRHHNSVKAKERSLRTASFLASRADRIPEKSRSTLNKRACNAAQKSERFKKQIEAQKQKVIPYKK